MKKFLIGFGGFLILLGTGGLINHISMSIKAVKEEQEVYGGSIYLMIIQLTGTTISPYLTCILGGGIIIAIAFFLSEYQKRSELTADLIKVIAQQNKVLHDTKVLEPTSQQEIPKELDAAATSSKPENAFNISTKHDNERYYWKG